MQNIAVVTGGAGFIGSHLCERLLREGYQVYSLDNYFAGSPENHIPGVIYVEGHTRDIAALISVKPDIVFHLGEYARVERSFEDVVDVWDLNMVGTFAVLEFCRDRKAKLVYAGSSTKFAEDGNGKEQSPYAFCKATNTELVERYGEWFGLSYAITYFYNVFGGRERGTGPYASLIGIYKEEYKKGNPLTVVLPGTQKRNFTHVKDIIEGLILVGKHGNGDGYGIGNDRSFSVQEVASMFGTSIVTLPPRQGNRMSSAVDTTKVRALGWEIKHSLPDDIMEFLANTKRAETKERRVLVISTTYDPIMGPAEVALRDLIEQMPDMHFDIVTSRLTKESKQIEELSPRVTIYRVGMGSVVDKFFLPILAAKRVLELADKHTYLFIWSLLASYAALAGVFAKKLTKLPLLITLADQNMNSMTTFVRFVHLFILARTDQVYATTKEQERHARTLGWKFSYSRTLGDGDAFANQIRFVYASILKKNVKQ